MKARFNKKVQEADNIWTYWFESLEPVSFEPGQFIELFLPHPQPDSLGVNRWFTLSSSPYELPNFSITTKHDAPLSSFKRHLSSLKPDTPVNFIEPMGDFILPKDTKLELFFIAAGIGITPYKSMVGQLTHQSINRPIHLMHAVSQSGELIFGDLFRSYPLKDYKPLVKNSSSSQLKLSSDAIIEFVGGASDKLIYVSGPELLVENLYKELLSSGLPQYQLAADYFLGYNKD